MILAPAGGATFYSTEPASQAVRGGADAEHLAAALVEAARARGSAMQPDGRFAALGAWVAGLVDDQGRGPPQSIYDFGTRHLGIAEDAPVVMTLAGGTLQERRQYMVQALASMPANIPYNRFGVVAVDKAGLPVSVVVVGASLLELQPVPRSVQLGDPLRVRGRVPAMFSRYEVVATAPDGTVAEVSRGPAGAFEATLLPTSKGTWRIEILAAGAWGLTVLANFPVYAGTEPPASIALRGDEEPANEALETTVEQVSSRMFELLNEARKTAGVPPLEPLPALAAIAEAHSRDMVESGFFGHVSPSTGDPSARVRAAGLRFPVVAENVGVGRSSRDVHHALLESPGHRGNMLNPKLTHVGIGVVLKPRDDRFDVYATQLFGRLARVVDTSKAPAQMLELVNAKRREASAGPLAAEPALDAAAAKGAAAYFQKPEWSTEQVLDFVVGEMEKQAKRGEAPWKRVARAETFLVAAPSLEDANTFRASLEPGARYVGIGVAQGTRPDGPDNMLSVMMIVTWPK